jgi:ubiquinone/menaquinone biosynthesis C-methylase UbiE
MPTLKRRYTGDMLRGAQKYMRGRALDVGAGTAKYAEMIKKNVSEYVTTDFEKGDAIDVVADCRKLPFEDESFDTVICMQVLEHVEHAWFAGKEMERVLKKGGHAIVTVPFLVGHHADPQDFYRYTPQGLASLFPNMEVIEARGYGGIFMILEEMFKFCFCNPYTNKKPGFVRRNLMRVVQRICIFLDAFSPFSNTLYCASFLIAKK